MHLNVATRTPAPKTHEGMKVKRITPELQLRRSVMSCMLWESQFYEDGEEISTRIQALAEKVKPEVLAKLAVEARHEQHLRHVPLLLLSILAKTGSGSSLVSDTIAQVISRADELAEFLAVYAKVNGVEPSKLKNKLSAQIKKGLARAFCKFDAYHLAKYDRAGAIRLRDVLFLCHAKPKDAEQEAVWKALVDGTLASPDSWEVALSSGADKKATFERLLAEEKLGYLALLRNLRGMTESGVDQHWIRGAILARKGAHNVLPFRYVAAARAAPHLERELDTALCAAIEDMPALPGTTVVLVDTSPSMNSKLSAKSDLTRMDAAATLACIFPGTVRVVAFSSDCKEVPPRRGMAGVDAIVRAVSRYGTLIGKTLAWVEATIPHDRIVVVTDEESQDVVPDPACERAYMINVASSKNGVGYGKWCHIDGFSESVLKFIAAHEGCDSKTED